MKIDGANEGGDWNGSADIFAVLIYQSCQRRVQRGRIDPLPGCPGPAGDNEFMNRRWTKRISNGLPYKWPSAEQSVEMGIQFTEEEVHPLTSI